MLHATAIMLQKVLFDNSTINKKQGCIHFDQGFFTVLHI